MLVVRHEPLARKRDHGALQLLARGPEHVAGDLVDLLPDLRVVDLVLPALAEVGVVQLAQLRGQPRGAMHAVRDRADRHLVLALAGVHPLPHAARHMAVQLAHPVVALGEPQGQGGHRKRWPPLLLLERDVHKLVAGEVQLGPVAPEELLHHRQREGVVAGRHRRVGRKDALLLHVAHGLVEGHALGHQLTAELQHEEGRVALVHVPDIRLVAKAPQGAHTADAQHQLLRDAHLLVAAVEPRRELAILGAIRVDVGVHQEERHAANLELVDLGVDRAAGQLHLYHNLSAVGVEGRDGGHIGEVELVVLGVLPPARVEALAKVALGVDEADRDEGQAHVAGLLHVVAGEDAEAARVDRQRLVDAKLGAEVGYLHILGLRVMLAVPGLLGAQVGVQALQHRVVALDVGAVGGDLLQLALAHIAQKVHGVMVVQLPEVGVDLAKQILRLRVPGPPEVVGQLAQAADAFRDGGKQDLVFQPSHVRSST